MGADKIKSNPVSNDKTVAFLIVDGASVIIIDKPIIMIGRKSSNDIVLNHEHVSRVHAQIRVIEGRYILQDLGSTVGTSVNGKKIDQFTLRPGDVISLGGIPIIFGRGSPKLDYDHLRSDVRVVGDSGPTENTDIGSADKYLDFFNPPKD